MLCPAEPADPVLLNGPVKAGLSPAPTRPGETGENYIVPQVYIPALPRSALITMKKRALFGFAMKRSPAPLFAFAALVFLLLVAGCSTSTPAPATVTSTPAPTVQTTVATAVMTPVPTTVPPEQVADKQFADAADACFNSTPIITDLTTHLAFATCMKNTPHPPGNCAQNYRYYVLKDTNEDLTTAGFARETTNAHLARDAYLRGEGYNGTSLEYVPCGSATLVKTSFYQ
jgi:hypothetical protein